MPDIRAIVYDYSGPLIDALDLSVFRIVAYDYAKPSVLAYDQSEGNP